MVHSEDVAGDVAGQVMAGARARGFHHAEVIGFSKFKDLKLEDRKQVVVFVLQTIEVRVGRRESITRMDQRIRALLTPHLLILLTSLPPPPLSFYSRRVSLFLYSQNGQPPENAGKCLRWLSRKAHPSTMLEGLLFFGVLGLGDSNLLLDRQVRVRGG